MKRFIKFWLYFAVVLGAFWSLAIAIGVIIDTIVDYSAEDMGSGCAVSAVLIVVHVVCMRFLFTNCD